MAEGTLFPTPVSQYDAWVIREALHNAIAHQDYSLGGKINIVEHPHRLIFSNLGEFIPPSVEWMLATQSPPEYYRNPYLVHAMIHLRMIDQMGSGIRRMFEAQKQRFFPLPEYFMENETLPRIEATIDGKILNIKYTQMLMKRQNLSLEDAVRLDKIQKKKPLSPNDIKCLKQAKLIEGRSPNYYISSKVAAWTGGEAHYIRNRPFSDAYYKEKILEYLAIYKKSTRKDIHNLIFPILSDILDNRQKIFKINNLLQSLRKENRIANQGSRVSPLWVAIG